MSIYKENPDGGYYDGRDAPLIYAKKRKKRKSWKKTVTKSKVWKVYKKWVYKGKEYQMRVK